MFPVAEKFVSINGEGAHSGEIAVFIRFRGCNLCCSYCDTKWANSSDVPVEMMSAQAIADYVKKTGAVNVTLTGGEPLLQKDVYELTDILISQGCRVEIETNGSIPIKIPANTKYRPVFTMDYKLPCSEMESRMCLDNFELLNEHDTVKFVSGSISDLRRAREVIRKYGLAERCHVFISPVFGSIDPADIVSYMTDYKMNNVRLQLQMHKFIWDPQKRGV